MLESRATALGGSLLTAAGAMMMLIAACGCPASADDYRDAGLRLAQHWCAGCHGIENAKTATDAVPSFSDIASTHGQDRRWITTWLLTPHPRMPDFALSRQEIDQLIAYLSSLPRHAP